MWYYNYFLPYFLMINSPIGIFDSGIGGLTVTKEIIRQLPRESIIFLGDTARVPYGTRSKEVITQFAKELVNFLLKRGVKALIAACNTISAVSLTEIEKESPVPIVGVVKPVVKVAVRKTKNKRIGVIGTQGTIESKAYDKEIKKLDDTIEVVSVGCPLFVPLAEEGLSEHQATKLVAEDYLDEIVEASVDTLVLGCTHYPMLLEAISETVGPDVSLVDSAKPTAHQLRRLLKEKNLLSNTSPTYEFFVTDAPQRVIEVASRFFGSNLKDKIKKVSLED